MLAQHVQDLYHNHPMQRSWRYIRHRMHARSVIYGLGAFLLVSGLYYHLWPRWSTVAEPRFPSAVFNNPPVLEDEVWDARAMHVREAFQHAYHGYEKYALPHDELKPVSNERIDNFNGWGVTLYDSLDTMLLMNLTDEFERAVAVLETATFTLPEYKYAPFFETVIRYLGGLLSAFALSKNPILLQRADDLARRLDPVFNSPSGFPYFGVNTNTGKTHGPEIGILAEIATLQLEYTYLGKATRRPQHAKRAIDIIHLLSKADLSRTGGMLPVQWSVSTSEPTDGHVSVGAQADSAHEYLLKQYLLTGSKDRVNVEMYLRTATYIITQLMFISPHRHLAYATDRLSTKDGHPGRPSHVFEHLSCFLPGLLALGAHTLPLNDLKSIGIDFASLHTGSVAQEGYNKIRYYLSDLKQLHLWAAESLAETCWLMYADQPSGLGPEEVLFVSSWESGQETLWIDAMNRWKVQGGVGSPPGLAAKLPVVYTGEDGLAGKAKGRDYSVKKPSYLLRPETIESLYLLWRITGDLRWRERGWWIFQSIERETKTQSGYSSVGTVEMSPAKHDDTMPSYFLAETLKYLYLLFRNDDPLPLDKWVFNTEAHPLPIFELTAEEKKRLGWPF
ncbi:hypothetical protein ONZ45_g15193 [Pleurotus djamor]|nr:hypothetical protein ONZ45_g15193 [Pleurotus djamor]